MKCYWWRPEPDWPRSADAAAHLRGPRVRNFGDEITEFLLKQMGISPTTGHRHVIPSCW
jgi:hypothetical protein